jgi:hypothetical protein
MTEIDKEQRQRAQHLALGMISQWGRPFSMEMIADMVELIADVTIQDNTVSYEEFVKLHTAMLRVEEVIQDKILETAGTPTPKMRKG